jgi:hypothetical protein
MNDFKLTAAQQCLSDFENHIEIMKDARALALNPQRAHARTISHDAKKTHMIEVSKSLYDFAEAFQTLTLKEQTEECQPQAAPLLERWYNLADRDFFNHAAAQALSNVMLAHAKIAHTA